MRKVTIRIQKLATCEHNQQNQKNAEVRAPGFSHLPPAGETRVDRIKTKELGTFREDTFTQYNAYHLIIKSL
jgi:hypothetical protein